MFGMFDPGELLKPPVMDGAQGLVLTSSTPSASTIRDQVLGLRTKGSPKLF